ncbi:four-carbon acid sugar kinase family protein [Ruania halotolerans]|uniref:four-carbon acid sugar kinase family protein n=1 Tax=Ruania halotolerans TaxID=2897773 RepID=UPI001E3AEB45|nr:four-carbon acid sugar kinase family protein [Ruania halotolerans]UFU06293.1 four-carbon acid sugar kinase family protein [Ruania halotolerans]
MPPNRYDGRLNASGRPVSDLRAGFYGDDFTGSVDALLQFSRRGWSGRLFTGLPSAGELADAADGCDVVGVAGIARSLPAEALEDEVRPALTALAALKPHVVQYKACSTVDSSPTIGSLGRVLEIGRDVVGEQTVPLLFAQPDFGRYTLFGHHFAAEGDQVYRLDRQPTMSTHPSTPMTESDVAAHLRRQTDLRIGHVPMTAYTGAGAVVRRLRESDSAALVLDAFDDDHLTLLGRALLDLPGPLFAIGSGGLSHALAAADPGRAGALARATPERGPVLVVSGSRSAQTRRQIDAAARAGWFSAAMPVDAGARTALVERVLAALAAGQSVALSSDDADVSGLDPDAVLPALARAAAEVVTHAVRAHAVRRVIVCGGDTSSRVTTLLGVQSLSIAANPMGNVVVLRAHSADPDIDGLELLLKGGQVGDLDLFETIRSLDTTN